MEIAEKMELQGICVLSPIYPINPDKDAQTYEEAQMLDKMHKEKIKLSDTILVIYYIELQRNNRQNKERKKR